MYCVQQAGTEDHSTASLAIQSSSPVLIYNIHVYDGTVLLIIMLLFTSTIAEFTLAFSF